MKWKKYRNFKVKNLILEKILFQDINSYSEISNLIKKTKTSTWVNHPRRMFNHYQQIKKELSKSNEKIVFQVVGGNWGLACNGLHFIDLCAFLTGKKVQEIDLEWVDNKIHESKRANNIEFTGSLKGRMVDNSSFTISSFDDEESDITVSISTNTQRWIVQEGRAQKIVHIAKENNYSEVVSSFTADYQSSLTTVIANDIFGFGKCSLPSYEEACGSHIPFIEGSIKKYVAISGVDTKFCPIT